jgi:hypothetical protein
VFTVEQRDALREHVLQPADEDERGVAAVNTAAECHR